MILLMLYRDILRILTQFLVNLSVIEKNANLPRVYNEWVDGWFCAHIPATSSLKTHFCLLSVSGLLEKAGMIFISETRDGSLRSGKPTLLLATWNRLKIVVVVESREVFVEMVIFEKFFHIINHYQRSIT